MCPFIGVQMFFSCQPVVAAVGDPFYKITSEALLVTQQLVKVIRPLGENLNLNSNRSPVPYWHHIGGGIADFKLKRQPLVFKQTSFLWVDCILHHLILVVSGKKIPHMQHNTTNVLLPHLYYCCNFPDQKVSFDCRPYVGDLYQCTLRRLKAADIDQEVKERAIACM